ncbi:hypothetical protein GLOIN_2v1599973 [Rhizophagus clarus]|uniref:Uncharacterized protein n=1 Tax=Rhizophagus clarus TaxID=94130 RepID=A0A8H3KZB1_9GLOM|nr:hypothetical protein GLOIN_2v1599973 [Rhizophagus clarus]
MENFASNINKPNPHNYNTNDVSMEEEYVSDFNSMDNDKYVNLNNINKCLDNIITEEDTFEDWWYIMENKIPLTELETLITEFCQEFKLYFTNINYGAMSIFSLETKKPIIRRSSGF